jgi:hypothetical protein
MDFPQRSGDDFHVNVSLDNFINHSGKARGPSFDVAAASGPAIPRRF